MQIRPAQARDDDAIWGIIGPTIRAGETYALPREMSRADALSYWKSPGHEVFVAEQDREGLGVVLGTYYMRANHPGGGSHIANCGYMTAQTASGQGVARAMCAHSLEHARTRRFRAMQFNFVISSNERAIALWQSFGFEIVGRLAEAFKHPRLGFVDAVVMYRML
jgi:ribosomal protein S18 acetylase RimI-like enzyme